MSIGRQDYQERREERLERFETRAAQTRAASGAAWQKSLDLVKDIPFGQPILVDHYSANSHRRTLDRSRKLADKAVALSDKAERQEERAAGARDNKAISGDDPEAVQKIKAKLEALTKAQEHDKSANAHYRKHETMKGFPGLPDADADRIDAELAQQDASPYSSGKHSPVPSWVLSNRNAEITRLKKRLAQLQAVDNMDHTEIDFDGGQIVTNEDINRVQILFDEKPDEETRHKLKSYGFRWSPREGAWQAQRTPRNLRYACHVLGVELPTAKPASETETPAQDEAPTQNETADDPQPETPQTVELAPGYEQALLPLS